MNYPLTEIEGEIAYPIFDFFARWLERAEEGKTYSEWQTKEAPEGCFFNSISGTSVMFDHEVDDSFIAGKLEEWWEQVKTKRPNIIDSPPTLRSEYVRNEVWFLTWFCHNTYDKGQTDEEILESFRGYVDRSEALNERLCYEQGLSRREIPKGGICLMGAEDRWRWRGENNGPPPCRCEGCKKYGLIRINH